MARRRFLTTRFARVLTAAAVPLALIGGLLATAADDKPEIKRKAAPLPYPWRTLISTDQIDSELQDIRKKLSASLANVGAYNGSHKHVRSHGATLAALAGIAAEHEGKIVWREDAWVLQTLGMRLSRNASGLGPKPFDQCRATFALVEQFLDGKKPAGFVPEPLKPAFAASADRKQMMLRMEAAKDWQRKSVKTEEDFLQSLPQVAQESAVLAALMQVNGLEGYEFADRADFRKHIQEMLDAAVTIQKSTETKDFKRFANGINTVQKKCDKCHSDFVGGA